MSITNALLLPSFFLSSMPFSETCAVYVRFDIALDLAIACHNWRFSGKISNVAFFIKKRLASRIQTCIEEAFDHHWNTFVTSVRLKQSIQISLTDTLVKRIHCPVIIK